MARPLGIETGTTTPAAIRTPVETATILLVEGDPALRTSLARGLGKIATVGVLATGTLKQASVLIESHRPSLIISALDLPGASGIDLIGQLERQQQKIPIIFITAHSKILRARIPSWANVHVLEKPVSLDELRASATQLLGPEATQRRPPLGLADYVQLACISGLKRWATTIRGAPLEQGARNGSACPESNGRAALMSDADECQTKTAGPIPDQCRTMEDRMSLSHYNVSYPSQRLKAWAAPVGATVSLVMGPLPELP